MAVLNKRLWKKIVGFDVRRHPGEFVGKLWPRDRRELFLLNSDVRWPLSVDSTVWPSLFRPKNLPPEYSMLVDFDEVLETEDAYVVDDLWFNFDQMRKCYARSSSSGSRGIEVAIQLVQDGAAPLPTWIRDSLSTRSHLTTSLVPSCSVTTWPIRR